MCGKNTSPRTSPIHNSDDGGKLEDRTKMTKSVIKNRHGMKDRKDNLELIMGKDISLEQIPDFLSQALVGHFCGKIVAIASLQHWISTNWGELLGYEIFFLLISTRLVPNKYLKYGRQ